MTLDVAIGQMYLHPALRVSPGGNQVDGLPPACQLSPNGFFVFFRYYEIIYESNGIFERKFYFCTL